MPFNHSFIDAHSKQPLTKLSLFLVQEEKKAAETSTKTKQNDKTGSNSEVAAMAASLKVPLLDLPLPIFIRYDAFTWSAILVALYWCWNAPP